MSQKQAMMKFIDELPEDASFDDVVETLNLVYDLRNRIDTFDKSKTITTEELKKEIQQW
ncbi:MAG: hypothetical protein IJ809_00305 [Clostridia bacterium]|nr:hypothetical protein [Clostridia bacterium]